MVGIGFVGLGDMGGPMARHLVEAGHDVTVHDLDGAAVDALVDAGATGAAGPPDVAADAEVVFLSLPGPDAVEAVVAELESGLSAGTVLVDTTTSTPGTTASVADRLATRDVSVLGAPVSGGRAGATAGTLSVMVGGDAAAVEACEPLFEAFAADVFHVGVRPGHGHAVKLLNNYLSFTAFLASSEALALGRHAGLDPETLLDVFNASSGRNSATEAKLPDHVVTERYDLGFELGLMDKDIRLLRAFAEEHDAPLMLAAVVRQLVGFAHADLGPDADMTRIYEIVAGRLPGE